MHDVNIVIGMKVVVRGDNWWFDWKVTDYLYVKDIYLNVYNSIVCPIVAISDENGRVAEVAVGMLDDFDFYITATGEDE